AVWVSWRMDETYIKVKGQWRYLDRAVDQYSETIDFVLTEHRDKEAALRFLTRAIRRHGVPETITIDGSAANEAAIKSYNEEHGTTIATCVDGSRCVMTCCTGGGEADAEAEENVSVSPDHTSILPSWSRATCWMSMSSSLSRSRRSSSNSNCTLSAR